jgi:hypothetical protein
MRNSFQPAPASAPLSPKPGKFKRWKKKLSRAQAGDANTTEKVVYAVPPDSASEKSFGGEIPSKQTKWAKVWLKKLQKRKSIPSQIPMSPISPTQAKPRIITLAEQLRQAPQQRELNNEPIVNPSVEVTDISNVRHFRF